MYTWCTLLLKLNNSFHINTLTRPTFWKLMVKTTFLLLVVIILEKFCIVGLNVEVSYSTSPISESFVLGCMFLRLTPQFLCFGSRWCSGHLCIWPCRSIVAVLCSLGLRPWSYPLRREAGVCRSPVVTRRPESRGPLQPARCHSHVCFNYALNPLSDDVRRTTGNISL